MLSRMFGALAVAALVAVGAALVLGSGGLAVSVTPMRASDRLPTFSQVQARLDGREDRTSALDPDAAPWARVEKNARSVRAEARKSALRDLEEIRRSHCGQRTSEPFGYYLEQRGMQERGYAANWGPAGAAFIAQAWSTPEDLRIVAGMRDAYESGWFVEEELGPERRAHLLRLIGPVEPRRAACR